LLAYGLELPSEIVHLTAIFVVLAAIAPDVAQLFFERIPALKI
jgi:hypothetical protein